MKTRTLLILLSATALLCACLKSSSDRTVGDTGTGDTIGTEVLLRAMPGEGGVVDAKNGREIWFAYGAITGNALPANGVATAHYLENGTYVLSLQVNIAEPADGTYYEAWLMDDTVGARFSAGHLIATRRPSNQTLRFEEKTDHRKSVRLAITREKDDGNPAPGEEVASGVLKVTKR